MILNLRIKVVCKHGHFCENKNNSMINFYDKGKYICMYIFFEFYNFGNYI